MNRRDGSLTTRFGENVTEFSPFQGQVVGERGDKRSTGDMRNGKK